MGTYGKIHAAGMPANKLSLGCPLYGNLLTAGTEVEIINILQNGTPGAYQSAQAEQLYGYSGDQTTADTAQSFCDKINWALAQGMRGIGLWELAQAYPPTDPLVAPIWSTIGGANGCLNLASPTATPTATPNPTGTPTGTAVASTATVTPSATPSPSSSVTQTLPTATATVGGGMVSAAGPPRVDQGSACPNPAVGRVWGFALKLSGPSDHLELRLYTPALVLAARMGLDGAWLRGWGQARFNVDLPPGLYYAVVRASRVGASGGDGPVIKVWRLP